MVKGCIFKSFLLIIVIELFQGISLLMDELLGFLISEL